MMDNAKKLLLVDPSHATQLYRPNTTSTKLTFVDSKIEATLNSDLPDDLKAKRYLTVLKDSRKYLTVANTTHHLLNCKSRTTTMC